MPPGCVGKAMPHAPANAIRSYEASRRRAASSIFLISSSESAQEEHDAHPPEHEQPEQPSLHPHMPFLRKDLTARQMQAITMASTMAVDRFTAIISFSFEGAEAARVRLYHVSSGTASPGANVLAKRTGAGNHAGRKRGASTPARNAAPAARPATARTRARSPSVPRRNTA